MKTIEEKAKAYDEALERANKQRADYQKELDKTDKNSQLAGLLRAGISAIDMAFPDLKESEDERMIRKIESFLSAYGVDYFTNDEWREIEVWLEKQKDASKAIEAVDRIDKYIDEYLANAHDMKDSNPDKKYYRGWDDALGKMAGILQDVYSDEKQKEQKHYWKPTETDVALFNKAVTTNKTLTPAERAQLDIIRSKFGCCRAVNCSGIVQKEQKLADVLENSDIKNSLLNHLEEVGFFLHGGFTKEEMENEWIKDWKVQKPVEWSEEDEKKREQIIKILEQANENWRIAQGSVPFGTLISWLKFLPLNLKKKNEDVAKLCSNAWNNEDEKIRKQLINICNEWLSDGQSARPCLNDVRWLKNLLEKQQQKPAEWSEESNEVILKAVELLNRYGNSLCNGSPEKANEVYKVADSLKSLRTQPKQEWSEEDEKMRQHIISDLREFRDCETDEELISDYEDEIDWLKSLRPHWKPTQEQIELLEKLSNYGGHYGYQNLELQKLVTQLKKL